LPEGRSGRAAVFSLLYNRIVYAVSWYNIASTFPLIATDFHVNVGALGLVTAVFIGSVGAFQVPGGLISAKIGPRRTAATGMFICSAAAIATAFVSDIYSMAVLRFVVGFGMALVYSPGVVLMMRVFRKGSQGLGVGLYSSGFDLGGIVGIFGWAVLAQQIGWRESVVIGGLLGLSSVFFLLRFIPADTLSSVFQVKLKDVRRVLLGGPLLVLAVTMIAMQVPWNVNGGFMVYYLEEALKTTPAVAGLTASGTLVAAIISGIIMGRVFDLVRKPKLLLLLLGLAAAAGTALASAGTLAGAAASSLIVGAGANGGSTIAVVVARALNRTGPEYDTLSVALINGLSNFASLTAPAIFSLIAVGVSYQLAWSAIGIYVALLLVPLTLFRRMPERL
jgi:MFS family permease